MRTRSIRWNVTKRKKKLNIRFLRRRRRLTEVMEDCLEVVEGVFVVRV